jgi:hypothetical protein
VLREVVLRIELRLRRPELLRRSGPELLRCPGPDLRRRGDLLCRSDLLRSGLRLLPSPPPLLLPRTLLP